jgi:hypothetical protein
MSVAATVYSVVELVAWTTDRTPKDEDVKAGGWGALVFVLLILAVVVLAFSLVKQLRRVDAAKEAGVYGDEPDKDAVPTTEPGQKPAP